MSRRTGRTAGLFLTMTLVATVARAQVADIRGIRAGVTSSPGFAFAGIRFDANPSRSDTPVRIVVTIDAAKGDQRALLGHLAVGVKPLAVGRSWSPYMAVGPAFVLAHAALPARPAYVGAALGILVGAEHRSRVSIETQINIRRDTMPAVFVAIGFRVF